MHSTAIDPDTIQTARLQLRGVAVRDASDLEALMRRPGVRDWLEIRQDAAPAALWLRALGAGGAAARRFVVTWQGADRPIGLVGLSRERRLHYLIDPEEWGGGIATEAVGAVLAHAFDSPDTDAVEAEVFDANPASGRVLQKLGFAPRHHLSLWRVGGDEPEPVTVYGLDRSSFERMT